MQKTINNRVSVGIGIGLATGLVFLLGSYLFGINMSTNFIGGLLLFYTLLGGMTACAGILKRHPLFDFNMPRYISGILMGVLFHLMLVLLATAQMTDIVTQFNIFKITNPFFILIDGAIIGLCMSRVETKFAGSGQVDQD